jgi:hypothetical protein
LRRGQKMANWHVATAAEAMAAAQFARLGCDVSVQYGANQPEYDLMIARDGRMLKISVKGSSNKGWGLSQSHLPRQRREEPKTPPNYKAAADRWLARHAKRTAMCFVNFRDAAIGDMPRIYLAWPKDVAKQLKFARGGLGDTVLWDLPFRNAKRASVLKTWRLDEDRVQRFLGSVQKT